MSNDQIRIMNTKASDWFTDEKEFRQLCGDAQSQARGESSQDFAAQMMIMANKHGLQTYLTYKQLAWLCKLADVDIPQSTHDEGPAPYRYPSP